MNAMTLQVVLTGASSRVDGSLGLRFATPELTAKEKADFFELQNRNLKMLLQPIDCEPAQLKEVKGQFDTKTPSQRLRAVLFILWKQIGQTGEFEDFYRNEMETIINIYKNKLEPEP